MCRVKQNDQKWASNSARSELGSMMRVVRNQISILQVCVCVKSHIVVVVVLFFSFLIRRWIEYFCSDKFNFYWIFSSPNLLRVLLIYLKKSKYKKTLSKLLAKIVEEKNVLMCEHCLVETDILICTPFFVLITINENHAFGYQNAHIFSRK